MANKGENKSWWQPPLLRTDEEEGRERRVTWLELFYDLVFVVIVAELAHGLSAHISVEGVLTYVLLFVPAWWLWVGATYYNDRFETEDVSHRLATFAQMIPATALAVFAHDGLGKLSVHFALAYAAGRVLISFLWLRGSWHNREFSPVGVRYAIGYVAAAGLWVGSIFVPAPQRFGVWIVALIIDLLTPFWTFRHQAKLPSLSSSHLPERFGLFTIIVLGEAVASVVRGLAALPELRWRAAVTGALGMALAFALWWIYFDFIGRRLAKSHIAWRSKQAYLHLPLLLSAAAVGAGVLAVIKSEADGLTVPEGWLISVASGLSLLSIGLIELSLPSENEDEEPFEHAPSAPLKIGIGAGVALPVGWGAAWLGNWGLLGALLFFTLIPVFYGIVRWHKTEDLPTGKEDDEGTANDTEGISPTQE